MNLPTTPDRCSTIYRREQNSVGNVRKHELSRNFAITIFRVITLLVYQKEERDRRAYVSNFVV